LHRTPESLLARYEALAAAGKIERDDAQLRAVAALGELSRDLAAKRDGVKLSWRWPWIRRARSHAPRGVYLWGNVGRGKTTLLDLFFESAPLDAKRRVHFYAFMAETHERLHRARRNPDRERDPVTRVGWELAQETRLLCFDEFAVNDIADATILARLFGVMFRAGVVLVATSNVEPRRLYEGGRNRELFLPFIALLERRVTVIEVAARADFRLGRARAHEVFFVIRDAETRERARARIDQCLGPNPELSPRLSVNGRKIEATGADGRTVRFDFAQICGQPLCAADYKALTGQFDAFIVENAPALSLERRNEAKRFVALVDVLYDTRSKLILTSEVEPEQLYGADRGAEAREFQRTVSRLHEMRSQQYVDFCARRAQLADDAANLMNS